MELGVAHIRYAICLMALLLGGALEARPFTLPLSARIVSASDDGKGWVEAGEMSVPYVQALASFRSELSRQGWAFVHAIPLSPDASVDRRTLCLWRKGGCELTMMFMRVGVSRTSFTWGVSKREVR